MFVKKEGWILDLEKLDRSGLVKIIDRIRIDLDNGNLGLVKSRLIMVYKLINEEYKNEM